MIKYKLTPEEIGFFKCLELTNARLLKQSEAAMTNYAFHLIQEKGFVKEGDHTSVTMEFKGTTLEVTEVKNAPVPKKPTTGKKLKG